MFDKKITYKISLNFNKVYFVINLQSLIIQQNVYIYINILNLTFCSTLAGIESGLVPTQKYQFSELI